MAGRWDAVVIGAGFAGAATAAELAERGSLSVLILEMEAVPGRHSSGLNAAMARTLIPEPTTARLARRGAAWLRATSHQGAPLLRQCGSLLLLEERDRPAWEEIVRRELEEGEFVQTLDRREVLRLIPLLEGSPFDLALLKPGDGVADIHLLLQAYLDRARAHGAELLLSSTLEAGEREAGGWRLALSGGAEVRARQVINAAGAWAGRVGELLGSGLPSPVPLRRHLFQTVPAPGQDPTLPFIWNVSRDAYFRPESGGYLFSACDEDCCPPSLPEVNPAELERAAEVVAAVFPLLADIPILACWAGLRTFAGDHRFVLGPDPAVEGLWWAAALGGHGMTTSKRVGEILAAAILGEPDPEGEAFLPDRLLP